MATMGMVQSYLRDLLEEQFGDELTTFDGGSELPYGTGVRIWVVDGGERSRRVLVTARAAEAGELTPKVLGRLNDLNAATPYGRYFWDDGAVFVEDTLLAAYLEPEALRNAIGLVGWASDEHADAFDPDDGAVAAEFAGGGAAEVALEDRSGQLVDRPTAAAELHGRVVNVAGYL